MDEKNTKIKVNWMNIGICCGIVSAILVVWNYASKWISEALVAKWPWFTEIEEKEES